jgi:hypothetical protein
MFTTPGVACGLIHLALSITSLQIWRYFLLVFGVNCHSKNQQETHYFSLYSQQATG